MRVPVSWLRTLVSGLTASADEVSAALVRAGLEVEQVHRVGHDISSVVVGEVLDVEDLTEFKKPIRYCKVDVGNVEEDGETVKPQMIICGARNFREGDTIVAALPGCVLPGGFALTVTAGPTTADGHDWYGVQTGDGRTGWVAGGFLALGQSWGGFVAGDLALVDAAPLNCRTGPGIGYDVSYLMHTGTGVQILAGPEAAEAKVLRRHG